MGRTIPIEQVIFHRTIDPNGSLFWWNGEPYRAVRRHHQAFTLRLFQSGIVDDLVRRGLLVPTEVTDWALKGYSLVLRHKRVPFISLFNEWNASMFRDAALAQLDLETVLESHGLMLQDGHTDNTLFDGTQPIFVDFCSIVPNIAARVWEAEDEYRRNFVNPLRLLSTGQSELLRDTMRNDRLGVPHHIAHPSTPPPLPPSVQTQWAIRAKTSARANLPESTFAWLKRQQRSVQRTVANRDSAAHVIRMNRLAAIREEVSRMTFPTTRSNAPGTAEQPSVSTETLRAVIDRLRPASVLDLDGTTSCARVVAQMGIATAMFAPSVPDSTQAYIAAISEGYPLLPVHIVSRQPDCEPAWIGDSGDLDDRYRADLVLALCLHPPHSVDRQTQLLKRIQQFTNRWILLTHEWIDEALHACFSLRESWDGMVLCERPSWTHRAANPTLGGNRG
ncbi:MAG: hypothetical protein U0452_16580 [Anaerolineae bacterium]